MCGIAGVIAYEENLHDTERICRRMQEAIARRGPDQQGMLLTEHAALIHTRLSIIDPENGRQPMHRAWREEVYSIVYNGELYNTPEIREQLARAGCRLTTHSDTEAVLMAYAVFGEDCLAMFNGIFAFAVWEQHRQRLFLARDRMGVKPLFYHLTPEKLIFGSELGCLLAHPDVPHEIGIEGVSQLLLFGPGRTPGCGVFRGTEELRAAECACYTQEAGLQKRIYWQPEAREHPDNFSQTAEHVRYLVTDAIRRQLVSDAPLGTFLSGGLDSSLISAVEENFTP